MSVLRPRTLPAGFIEPCIPTAARVPPCGPDWVHEIKHDGYRLIARSDNGRTRLFSRRGHDWTERFPRIRDALASLEARSATIDGEAVVCCPKSGLTLFDRLHSGKFDREVILYAFDLLELNGDDLRKLPLCQRKAKLTLLLISVASGIALGEHIEADGAIVFQRACEFGCEGIVSKRRDSPYRSGQTKTWIKVKNPDSPAMTRVWEG